METKGVSSAIISAVRVGVVEQLSSIAKYPFDGARIQYVEKQFVETLGKSGASGLSELFFKNDERAKAIIHDGQKHYRKFVALGRYLTLLGEISLKRGIYQSNNDGALKIHLCNINRGRWQLCQLIIPATPNSLLIPILL